MVKAMGDFTKFATNLPEELDILIHKIRKGKLHIEFEHKGLENFLGEMEEVSKRISLTIVLSAIILGSSLIVIADVPPKLYGIPLLSFVGFSLAGFLGLFWIRSVLKKDKY